MSESAKAKDGLVGKVILGRYRIVRHLADGGMGAIYLARNEGAAGFVRPVVIKCLLPSRVDNEAMLQLFMREARIMSSLRHPGIVGVIDFAEEDGMHVMVMEYVHGFHLGRWHRFMRKTKRPFPVEIAIHAVVEVLRALHYAHMLKGPDRRPLNIVHRDVTPSNVLIDVEGHVKLSDFGIARTDTERTAADDRTIKGKFPYLAPELLEDDEPSPASDVYSAGLILHELLIGRNEFWHKDVASIVARVLKHEPTRVDELRDVPDGLADVIAKALSKSKAKRYQTASELADALGQVRTMNQDDASALLEELASADFRDQRMADLFSAPPLDDLESTWTTPSGIHIVPDPTLGTADIAPIITIEGGTDSGIGTEPGSMPDAATSILRQREGEELEYEVVDPDEGTPGIDVTTAASPSALSPGPETQRRHRAAIDAAVAEAKQPTGSTNKWLIAVAGLAIVAVGAVAVLALLRSKESSPTQEPQYIVVSDRDKPAPQDPDELVAASVDAGPAAVASTLHDAAPAKPDTKPRDEPKDTKPANPVDRLTRSFGKQKRKVVSCFKNHAVDIEGSPKVYIRFVVGTDGKVVSAEVIPASLATTELGKCLHGVAKATKFDKQDRQVAFRVPVQARIRKSSPK
jgi:serine/threonine-protein kinase